MSDEDGNPDCLDANGLLLKGRGRDAADARRRAAEEQPEDATPALPRHNSVATVPLGDAGTVPASGEM